MAILLIVLATAGLCLKAGVYGAAWRALDGGGGGHEGAREPYMIDLVWIVLALSGLLLLEVRYGTMLPAGSP